MPIIDPKLQNMMVGVVLLTLGFVILWIGTQVALRYRREWLEPVEDEADEDDEDPLAPFQRAFEQGQLNADEFRRIQEQLAAQAEPAPPELKFSPGSASPRPLPTEPTPESEADPDDDSSNGNGD